MRSGGVARRVLSLIVLAAGLLLGTAAPTWADAANRCPAGQAPRFSAGFAELHGRVGAAVMGDPLTCEFPDPNGTGDVHQQTTRGLAFWRKATNTPTFTNGSEHWGLTSRGLVTWQGASADPPSSARAAQPPASAATALRARSPSSRADLPLSGLKSFVLPTYDAPTNDTELWCLDANPSCNRDPWWIEWNELQGADLVQYSFLGPGFVTEDRFVEAVWLIWQWPEGKSLLRDAAAHGVDVATARSESANQFASYTTASRTVWVAPRYTETSTWMVADVLVHELTHAADRRAGRYLSSSYDDCITREQQAFRAEVRFARWLDERFGLPTPAEVAGTYSWDNLDLYFDLYRTLNARDLDASVASMYRDKCAS